jgi:hypothetical protein
MAILFTVILIAAIGYVVYRNRASFTDAKDPPVTGPADNTADPVNRKDKL